MVCLQPRCYFSTVNNNNATITLSHDAPLASPCSLHLHTLEQPQKENKMLVLSP